MRPHDLGITVSAEEEDVLSGQVWDHRPLGIRIESGPDGASRLTASFASRTAAEACAAALGRPAEVRPSPSVDWEAVNAGLPQVEVGSHALRISPGLVFGWGGHPSTRLLLDALAAEPPSGLHVLDAGCGSGVLSVAAAALGAAAVTAVDVDPVAVEVTGENARRNGVGERISASTTPLSRLAPGYGLVLANLLLRDLIAAAPDLDRLAAGHLAVSGFLSDQVDAVRAAFGSRRVRHPALLDGWAALILA